MQYENYNLDKKKNGLFNDSHKNFKIVALKMAYWIGSRVNKAYYSLIFIIDNNFPHLYRIYIAIIIA